MPDDTTIYGDPRYVAVAWTPHPSNDTTEQVLGSKRRCLPFLARYEVVDLVPPWRWADGAGLPSS